ncbi:hypothetical protein V8C86DRAFT_1277979 [Haematococcus lacustris]
MAQGLKVDPFSFPFPDAQGADLFGSDAFTPFSIDVSPLQKFLLTLARQVEQLQADNAVLREELASLKINKRLEILEAGLQELAETSQTASGYAGGTSGSTFAPEGVASAGGPLLSGTAADSSWVLFEFSSVKERLTAFERRAEALWHVKEGGEELKGIVDRLKTDVERVQAAITETQASSRVAQQHAERMDSQAVATRDAMHDIGERLSKLDIHNRQASEERREAASKVEAHVNSIWDQIRHVENSLSQRLTLAETSQVRPMGLQMNCIAQMDWHGMMQAYLNCW